VLVSDVSDVSLVSECGSVSPSEIVLPEVTGLLSDEELLFGSNENDGISEYPFLPHPVSSSAAAQIKDMSFFIHISPQS